MFQQYLIVSNQFLLMCFMKNQCWIQYMMIQRQKQLSYQVVHYHQQAEFYSLDILVLLTNMRSIECQTKDYIQLNYIIKLFCYLIGFSNILKLKILMFDLSNFAVKILQLGASGLIASKMLSDYGCKVINSLNLQQNNIKIDLLIIDQKTFKKDFANDNKLNMIILTGNNISPIHILAQSGLLSVIGQQQTQIFDPKFIVQYMLANSLTILCLQKMLLKNKNEKYKLQVSVIDLVSYYGAFFISAKQNNLLDQVKGRNVLDGGAPFYSIYKCKEGNLAVGNLQPKFYQEMVKGLNFEQQINQFLLNNQLNITQWPRIRTILTKKFKQKSAKEWQIQLNEYDTCVTEVRNSSNEINVEPKINWLYKSKL